MKRLLLASAVLLLGLAAPASAQHSAFESFLEQHQITPFVQFSSHDPVRELWTGDDTTKVGNKPKPSSGIQGCDTCPYSAPEVYPCECHEPEPKPKRVPCHPEHGGGVPQQTAYRYDSPHMMFGGEHPWTSPPPR